MSSLYTPASISKPKRRAPVASTPSQAHPHASSHQQQQQQRDLTDDQRLEIKEAFDLFDTDKDGAIDYHELKVAMRALGFDLKKAEVLKLLRDYDKRGEGVMVFDDFLKISASRELPNGVRALLQLGGRLTEGSEGVWDGSGASFSAVGVEARSVGHRQQKTRRARLVLALSTPCAQATDPARSPPSRRTVTQHLLARDPREEIRRAFELFDDDRTGKISVRNLRRVAKELGEGLDEDELCVYLSPRPPRALRLHFQGWKLTLRSRTLSPLRQPSHDRRVRPRPGRRDLDGRVLCHHDRRGVISPLPTSSASSSPPPTSAADVTLLMTLLLDLARRACGSS